MCSCLPFCFISFYLFVVKNRFLIFLGIMGGYALITEVLQEAMDLGRSMEILDWVADMVGILLAFGVWKKYLE